MKILDPQSAVLSTLEVHQFFKENPPRPRPKKIGSYQPVDLKNYDNIRQDFARYVSSTVPYVADQTSTDAFIKDVVPKLRRLGLTKTEALMLVNLGIGIPKKLLPQTSIAASEEPEAEPTNGADDEAHEEETVVKEEGDEDEEMGEADPHSSYDRQMIPVLVEELEDRFPGGESESKIEEILQTLRDSYDLVTAADAGKNGAGTNGTGPT